MIVQRVKVFTTDIKGINPDCDGEELTEKCNKFLESDNTFRLVSVHTNSNKYGWMLTIVYECGKSDY